MKQSLMILFMLMFLIAGCAQDTSDPQAPAKAIENYIQAQVDKDSEAFQTTYCADFEFDAITEFDSYGAVEASIEAMTCEVASMSDMSAAVTCSGTIDIIYDGENNRTFDLSRFTYNTVQEDGEWKMCGYGG